MDWDYAPAPESASIGKIKDRYLPFVDGEFVEGKGADVDTINPGTGGCWPRCRRPATRTWTPPSRPPGGPTAAPGPG